MRSCWCCVVVAFVVVGFGVCGSVVFVFCCVRVSVVSVAGTV